jgi:Protein of unknown function (DUF1572)
MQPTGPTADEVTRAALGEASAVLDRCAIKIRHCVEQLSDEQIWWRPDPALNSIGNLILHLTGNVRQWIVSGLGGSADVRNRPAEFAERGPIPKGKLLTGLSDVVREATAVMRRVTAADMAKQRVVQGYTVTGWGALFDAVPHFQGHTQEIVGQTRMQLKDRYQFLNPALQAPGPQV